jgi:hypothetical protein
MMVYIDTFNSHPNAEEVFEVHAGGPGVDVVIENHYWRSDLQVIRISKQYRPGMKKVYFAYKCQYIGSYWNPLPDLPQGKDKPSRWSRLFGRD